MQGIRFTKRASKRSTYYGFQVSPDVIERPARVDRRGEQYLAIKPIGEKYALRVVYEVREDIKVVMPR